MKVAILTTSSQWFVPYAKILNEKIENSQLFFDHKAINKKFDILFILSYHSIIEEIYLKNQKYNIIVHESKLPRGKGWSPMFWQILEGENEIPFTMFEALANIDSGNIYMQKTLYLTGYELNKELRQKQAHFSIEMCLEFLNNFNEYKISIKQSGNETFYKKRMPKDSELNIDKSIREEFNLLRIIDNDNYPAFFYKNNKKYIIKIEEDNDENR